MIDINTVKHVHFIGIGGVSNSAIAEILHHNGYQVSGSDIADSVLTKRLAEKGITIYKGHHASNIKDAELVVYTAAVGEDNAELHYALSNNIPCLSRAEVLGQLMIGYNMSIAVSGTHGKTTTTSMLTRIFNDKPFNPTALIGGDFAEIGSNVLIGDSDIFITEACEYKESFLSFYPQIGIILNVDADHLDYYDGIDQIVEAFLKFSSNIKENGLLVVNGDDFNARKIINSYKGHTITFGINTDCDYTAKNIVYDDNGNPSFDLIHNGICLKHIVLTLPGQHHIYNAMAAFIVAVQIVDDSDYIAAKLSTFKNANRRFEHIGKPKGILLIDDYAHHPVAIKANLEAARRMTNIERIYCVFQPHTYSRTKELLHEFSRAFFSADEVIITDIYAARENDPGDIHAKDLYHELLKENVNAKYFATFDEIETYLSSVATSGDLILSLGAGDIYHVTKDLNKLLAFSS